MLSEGERCDRDEGQGYSVMVALKWKVSGKEHGLRGKEECLAHCLSYGMCLENACHKVRDAWKMMRTRKFV